MIVVMRIEVSEEQRVRIARFLHKSHWRASRAEVRAFVNEAIDSICIDVADQEQLDADAERDEREREEEDE